MARIPPSNTNITDLW